MLKDDILAYLEQLTREVDLERGVGDACTAEEIARRFQVKRNTVSHYLNQELGASVFKINTRPVVFFHRGAFEAAYGRVDSATFESLAELSAAVRRNAAPREADPLSDMIGAAGSLKRAVEQIKAAVFYPKGLPVFLSGPTGVGKSFLAKRIYRYSVAQGALKPDAPFITMNCAQYANNVELLSSNLFGHVKGAFTGACQTERGVLEAANGGMLFLDEVHRLNFENQEKLFVFLDQGIYRRLGESDAWHSAEVRIVMATTEDMESSFLDTFLRRIPIIVHIPALKDRGYGEQMQFIRYFFHEESKILKRRLCISGNVLDALSAMEYTGNVGELQNWIKYICASTYARCQAGGEIALGLKDLPEPFVRTLMEGEAPKAKRQVSLVVSPDAPLERIYDRRQSFGIYYERLYQLIGTYFRAMKETGGAGAFEQKSFAAIRDMLDQLYYSEEQGAQGAHLKYVVHSVQDAFQYLEHSCSLKFGGSLLHALTVYYYYYPAACGEAKRQFSRELTQYLREHYRQELQIAKSLSDLLLSKLDVEGREEDVLVLALYLRGMEVKAADNGIKAIIAAHGFATASSIAGVANRLLEQNIFEAVDMPLHKGANDVADWVKDYIRTNDVSGGLLLMVDTGSLYDIYTLLESELKVPVAVVNNVTTQMALAAGQMIKGKERLEAVLEHLEQRIRTEYKLIYPQARKERVLICCCISGVGAAEQIRELLEGCIPGNAPLSIVTYDYQSMKNPAFLENLKRGYDVLGVIGTTPLQLDAPFAALDEILDGSAGKKLEQMLAGTLEPDAVARIGDGIVRSFSMKRLLGSLTILDTDKVIGHIEQCIAGYETLRGVKLKNGTKISLTIHIGCLIERLIRNMPIETYDDLEKFEHCQQNELQHIREALTVIEKVYSVKIPVSELGYIHDILCEL